jgi:hypothetical protein
VPIVIGAVAAIAAGAAIYGVTHMDKTIRYGGILWVPLLGSSSLPLMITSVEGVAYARECRAAKRQGAEQAAAVRREEEQAVAKAEARAAAGALWKRAAAAARTGDCASVREVDPQIRGLDVELHTMVFSRDVAIGRCLAPHE